jgi:hypothetical protein
MIFACILHRQYCKIKHCNQQQACAGALTTEDSKLLFWGGKILLNGNSFFQIDEKLMFFFVF